ncbi:MAG: 3-deoxy-D-manno-octulosonate cytidylyltransferase [Bacteroidetes bacterium 4572_117]|nr:MAG: 3-deoxy-D-manno-octulosonate cytidylyltransferase [Bacteroidetes bacterium 4572_117]
MNVLGIIPARWASSRFLGKPLVKIGSKSMIERVYKQSAKTLDNVIVATDDMRIFEEVRRFNGQVVMTSEKHQSGTDRCYEALKVFQKETSQKFDFVINIQGDEPFIQGEQIKQIIGCFKIPDTQIVTLVKKITEAGIVFDPSCPKVIMNTKSEAIYFSRSTIPYINATKKEDWFDKFTFYEHLGLYGYKSEILSEITKLPPSSLENAESLEQNRWLENAFKIKVVETDHENISIDTQEDLDRIIEQGFID